MWRIVIAFEMGGGWGHLLPLRAIAREFVRRGCQVTVLCRAAEKARGVFSGMGIAVEQAPAWEMRKVGFSLNYAHCVWGNGYWDKEMFRAHFRWWTKRFRSLRPDYVLTDFAPTALLVALTMDLPRGAVGTGFTLPPLTVPAPSLHPWLEIGENELSRYEEALAATVKGSHPSVACAADIFRGAERFLTIVPETDHYGDRLSDEYWGPLFEKGSDGVCPWPDGNGLKVFFYLSGANRCLSELTGHFRKRGLLAVGHVRDLPETRRAVMESPTVRLCGSLIDDARASSECDLAVTHGGFHTTVRMLFSGVPLLLCPEQLEQAVLAYRLHKRGLCEFVSFFTEPDRVAERFDSVASSAVLRRNAALFAEKYAGYDPEQTVREIVHACLGAAR